MKAFVVENNAIKILLLKITSKLFKHAALYPLAPVQFTDVPEPKSFGRNRLKVNSRSCGLCATDIHLLFMDMNPKILPAASPESTENTFGMR